jgi:hypothetical protein
MNPKRLLAPALGLLCLAICAASFTSAYSNRALQPQPDDGCSLTFGGDDSSRKAVKLRKPGLNYTKHNGGRAVSVADFFSFVCTLDPNVPTRKKDVPLAEAMPMEKEVVKLRAFVLAMKLDPDKDLHVQIADSARPYTQQQLIVEIPPGADYCDARSAMMELFRADGGRRLSGNHVFSSPPEVELTGYLFLDAFHMRARRTDFCTDNGGRGIRDKKTKVSPVRGIWEVHPVFELKKVS